MTRLYNPPDFLAAKAGSILPRSDREQVRAALRVLVGPSASQRLLDSAGETGLLRWPAAHLAAAGRMSQRSAERVVAARELLRRVQGTPGPSRVTCSADVIAHLPPAIRTSETEVVIAAALSAAIEVQAVLIVAQGGAEAPPRSNRAMSSRPWFGCAPPPSCSCTTTRPGP